MASSSSFRAPAPKIIESIVEAGKKAFDPNVDASTRAAGVEEYNQLIERSETWALLPALNTLIKPNVLPPWLRDPLLQTLTLLPLRPDGVRGTMEFVFSVHPSNIAKATDSSGPQKQGASITHEAVAVTTKLLSSVPGSMTPEAWFGGIADQLLQLMDGKSGQDLAKTSAQIVGYGILGKKQYGAPGTAGWNSFVQPLIEALNPSLMNENLVTIKEEDDIIDLSQDKVLIKAESLKVSLQRLSVLLLSNPSSGLYKRVLRPVLLQLWALASWLNALPLTDQEYVKPARTLLEAYLRLFGSRDTIWPLIQYLLSKGSPESAKRPWKYRLTGKGEIEIVEPPSIKKEVVGFNLNWNELEEKAATLVRLVTSCCSKEEISSIFLDLLRRWIQAAGKEKEDIKIDIPIQEQDSSISSPVLDLIEVTILQRLMEQAPENLVSHFDQLLELICQVFRADAKAQLADDLVAVVLSLLNLVVTAPTFQKSDIKPEELEVVEASLNRLSNANRAQISPTARNLAMLLKYRDEVEEPNKSITTPSNRQIEDRKTYSLAMNYITGSAENPPPVVAEGLNLISSLILAESPILDIPAVTVLMSNLLAENDDFINLRVIKVFTQLANKHPNSAVQELLDHYLDPQEKASTDVRLRFGEALLQVVERLGQTFAGDIAQKISETLLSIAGRRGYRPKTLAKQVREEKRQKMKKKETDDDGAADLMDEDEDITEEEKATNDILAQILQGWESKRGSEDVRIRASALSIFGTAIETNIGGIGPTLVSASVDLSINVLTIEREMETGILRRAAVLNILSFVRALDKAKESNTRLGFGLTDESREDIVRTLHYVAATDNDGLVQQHANDVIESLENWQISSMMPSQAASSGPELMSLAGLHVNPAGTLVDGAGRPRPRIEEVE